MIKDRTERKAMFSHVHLLLSNRRLCLILKNALLTCTSTMAQCVSAVQGRHGRCNICFVCATMSATARIIYMHVLQLSKVLLTAFIYRVNKEFF